MNITLIESQVEKGVALLDEKVPGWETRVDPDALHMWNMRHCVLGQLFQDYMIGLRELGLSDESAVEYGFDRRTSLLEDSIEEINESWAALDSSWRSVIRSRRAAA
jgi:hypothetical protein